MPVLSAGTTLGPYQILSPLGSGGMGEVYRARDTRLGRDVAIKALPEAFARDPERLARFEREARLLASLHHTNIAGIHGLEESGGHRFLVLECVEGETLQSRIAGGPLPLREALDVCRQIAMALEAAHESGIVHRDLKPGNVMLTPDGQVKVLDFGLARGGEGAGSSSSAGVLDSPTISLAATAAGVILGTAAYMSPEQARGRAVDKRTDIWSFGCVLLECLTGRQEFAGETVSDTIARILERAPDLGTLPARTPRRVRELLLRCLQKDARERLRDIGDARLDLTRAMEELDSGVEAGAATLAPQSRASVRVAWGVAALSFAAAALAVAWPHLRPAPAPAPVRFSIPVPRGHSLSTNYAPGQAAISPDGRSVAFPAMDSSGTLHLWVRELDEMAPRRIPGSENAIMPFWSPDSRYLAFYADGKLRKARKEGGEVEIVCPASTLRGGTWSRSGTIVFAPAADGPIFKVPASGGVPEAVTTLDTTQLETAHRFPSFLEDGRHFIFVATPARMGRHRILVGSVDGMKPKPLLEADGGAVYAPPGWVLYPRGKALMAQRLDPGGLRATGEPLALADSPERIYVGGIPGVSVSRTGALAYVPWSPTEVELFWYGMDGRLQGRVPVPPGPYDEIVPSPEGLRFVADRWVTPTAAELWLLDGGRGIATRLSGAPGFNGNGHWSPDGRSIVFQTDRRGPSDFYRVDLSGGMQEDLVYEGPGTLKNLLSWPSGHNGVLFNKFDARSSADLWWLPFDGDRRPVVLVQTPALEGGIADVSPDGSWLLYGSDASGRSEIYARPFAGGREVQVTTTGSLWAFWRKGGREILNVSPDLGAVTATAFEPGDPPLVGSTRQMFTMPEGTTSIWYDPPRDRFLVGKPTARKESPGITVLLNWTSALKKP